MHNTQILRAFTICVCLVLIFYLQLRLNETVVDSRIVVSNNKMKDRYMDIVRHSGSHRHFADFLNLTIIPSINHEFENETSHVWVTWYRNQYLKKRYHFDVFLYQKLNSSFPNYASPRGGDGSVYLQYIVDHYGHLPSIMVFTKAVPYKYTIDFLEMIDCVGSNTSYASINDKLDCASLTTSDSESKSYSKAMSTTNTENSQNMNNLNRCWRQVLGILNDSEDSNETTTGNARSVMHHSTGWHNVHDNQYPTSGPITVRYIPFNQFIVSKNQVLRRTLSTYTKLLHIINGPFCMSSVDTDEGDSSLSAFTSIVSDSDVQGDTMMYLSHAIFGHQDIDDCVSASVMLAHNLRPGCYRALS